MIAQVELTDTFCGEANYGWIRRATLANVENATDAQIKRRAKAAVYLTGIRGEWETCGDLMTFRPRNLHQILFVTVED